MNQKLAWLLIVLCLPFLHGCSKLDFSGSWTFTWDDDIKNTNTAVLKHEGSAITGIYINDSKENCSIMGALNSSGDRVTLTITCPKWDIQCDGSIEDPASVTGQYSAYGDSNGSFKMSRN